MLLTTACVFRLLRLQPATIWRPVLAGGTLLTVLVPRHSEGLRPRGLNRVLHVIDGVLRGQASDYWACHTEKLLSD